MSIEEIKEASTTAVELIGTASAKILRLRREKLVSSINKFLVPLMKEDSHFSEVVRNLFGSEFSKRAKDFMDQVKTLRSSFQNQARPTVPEAAFSKRPSLGDGNDPDKGRRPQSIQGRP